LKTISTYRFHYYNDKLFELCQEAGRVYNKTLDEFWRIVGEEEIWLSKFELQKRMSGVIERENLHSDSFLAAMQQVHSNLASWKQAKKVVPNTKAPYRHKFLQPVFFKKSQIKYKNGYLVLTLDKNRNYIVLPWNQKVPLPIYGQVGYNKTNGWQVSLAIERDVKEENLDPNRAMSIDLGVKRIAALFDENRVVTLSGKKLMSLLRYRNKTDGDYREKLSKKKKRSKKYKRLQRSRRKAVARMQNIQKDILHKQSSFIVDYAVANKIGKIVFGDNSSTHNKTNCGKNNQKIQQFPEQKLRKYVEEKFNRVSGVCEKYPEPYTSQRCPICKNLHKTKNRTYKCKSCGYTYDRDGVGAINIYKENVSSIENGRIRRLARPFGVKFKNNLSLFS